MSAMNGKSQTAQRTRFDFAQPSQDQQVSVPMPNGQIQSNNILSGQDLMGLAQQNFAGLMGVNQQDNAHMREIVGSVQQGVQSALAQFERMADENSDSTFEVEWTYKGR